MTKTNHRPAPAAAPAPAAEPVAEVSTFTSAAATPVPEPVVEPAPAPPAEPEEEEDDAVDPNEGKIEVITTGPFMLIDPTTREEVEPEVPCWITDTDFIRRRITAGALELLS